MAHGETLDDWITDLRSWPTPMRDFIQFDGWAKHGPPNDDSDVAMKTDKDGDVTIAGLVRDPQRSGTTVRIQVARGADPADVVRVLRKLVGWIERNDSEALRPTYWNDPPMFALEVPDSPASLFDEPPF